MTKRDLNAIAANANDDNEFGDGAASHLEGCACSSCCGSDSDKIEGGGRANAPDSVPGNTSSTATAIVGGVISGSIDTAGDSDWYSITLTAGQTYTFSTILGAGALADSILRLRDSSGALIAQNDDAIANSSFLFSEITYTATTSGTFFLDVTGYTTSTGSFYLTSTAPVSDTIAASAATTASLTLDAPATAGTLLSNGDHDWYAVELVAGQIYEFTTTSATTANVDTTLMLRNASGTLLSYNDDSSGTFSRIRYIAATSGTFYLDVAAWGNAESGNYNVSASIAPPLSVYSSDQISTQLTNTYWDGTQRSWNLQAGGTITVNITGLTAPAQTLAREALLLWTDATGINFSEIATDAQITFDDNEPGAFAQSTVEGGFITSSQINVSEEWLTSSGSTLRSYTFQAYIHEIGHTLGLGHGGNYNAAADYTQDASYLNDSWATTIMSYFDQSENTYFANRGFSRQFTVTPLVADIVATTNLYGTATTTRTGDSIYGVGNNTGRSAFNATATDTPLTVSIVDHGGTDMLDYSVYATNQLINLNSDTFSNVGARVGNVSIARGSIIENAITGSGNDTLIGNAAINRLEGGLGNDSYFAGAGDIVVDAAGSGYDIVYATSNYTLNAGAEIEVLGTVDNTATTAINLTGNELRNFLTGNAGNNVLDGQGGADYLGGRGGDDSYYVDADDIVLEAMGDGNDTVYARTSYTLYGGMSVETLATADAAATTALNLRGNELNNRLIGNAGANTLAGGLGNDVLEGGLGNDSYFVDSGDAVNDAMNSGYDIIYASADFILSAGSEIEVLGTLDNGATGAINLTGNAMNNYLTGNAGSNILNGQSGNDYLGGRGGNDTFVFGLSSGADAILDFSQGQDKIDVSAYGLSFAQLQASFVQQGSDGLINLGNGNSITLYGVTMSLLAASDFVFAGNAEAAKATSIDVMDIGKAFQSEADLGQLIADPVFLDQSGLDRWGILPSGNAWI